MFPGSSCLKPLCGRFSFLFLSIFCFLYSASFCQNYLSGYCFPSDVQEDLEQGFIDSSRAENILDLFENPVDLAPDDAGRLQQVPGITRADIKELMLFVARDSSLADYPKRNLVSAFVTIPGKKHGMLFARLYPSQDENSDYYKRAGAEITHAAYSVYMEGFDDSLGTGAYKRYVRFKNKGMECVAGNFKLHIAEGLVAGSGFPRFIHRVETALPLQESVLFPAIREPNGVMVKAKMHEAELLGYYSINGLHTSHNIEIAGSAFKYKSAHVSLGIQGQAVLKERVDILGSFFTWSHDPLAFSGEAAFSKAAGPSWLVSFERQGQAILAAQLYRYPFGTILPLANPACAHTGGTWVTDENDTLRTFIKPEQGITLRVATPVFSMENNISQGPAGQETELHARISANVRAPLAIRLKLEEHVFVNEADSLGQGPALYASKTLAWGEASFGAYGHTGNRTFLYGRTWLRCSRRVFTGFLLWAKAQYNEPESQMYGRWLISLGEELNIPGKAEVYAALSLPVARMDKTWANVRVAWDF